VAATVALWASGRPLSSGTRSGSVRARSANRMQYASGALVVIEGHDLFLTRRHWHPPTVTKPAHRTVGLLWRYSTAVSVA
jgi:hypothetical protein